MPVNVFIQVTIFQKDVEAFQGFEDGFVIDTSRGVSKIDKNNCDFNAQISKVINCCFQYGNQLLPTSLIQKGSLPRRNFVHYVNSDPES